VSHQIFHERQIVRALRAAGRIESPAAEYAGIAAAVRESLAAATPARPRVRTGRWAGRRRLATGIAAAVATLLVGLSLLMLVARPRSAWAQLQAAAEATGQFRGWVSVHAMLEDGSEGPPLLMIDTDRGSRVEFGPADARHRLGVRFMDHPHATDSYYSPAADQIFISELSPNERERTYEEFSRHFNLAVDFRQQLKNMGTEVGAGNLDVRSSREGGLERFDVDWYLRDANGRRQRTPVHATTYWVNPATQLITKARHMLRDRTPSTFIYRYNDPVVHDIYDLGVPRDAKIVDHRPTGPLRDRLDRIDRRIAAGTGDGVAIVTTTVIDQGAPAPGRALDTLEIYAQSGERWIWAQYLVGQNDGRKDSLRPQLEPPPGWPHIEPAAALELVKDLRPADLLLRDGKRSYRAFSGDEPPRPSDAAHFGLPGRAWPGRYRLRTYEPWSAASLRQNADGSETIVVEMTDRDGGARVKSEELTLDKQSGLPTSAADRPLGPSGKQVLTERWTFTSNLKTPAGIVLPEHWTYSRITPPGDKRAFRTESTLRFDPRARVPETWFYPPARRFNSK
jgi:hypothetical protein